MDFTIIHDNLSYLLWGQFPDGPLGGCINAVDEPYCWSSFCDIRHFAWGGLSDVAWLARCGIGYCAGLFPRNPSHHVDILDLFLLPIVFGVDIPEITTVVCALALIASSYLAHAVAAGIHAVGRGQWQAGLSLGLNRWQVLGNVVLPQALRMMVPSFINQWISLIKDTSLAYIVGVSELTFLATQVNNRSMVYPMEVFMFVAGVYFVMCLALDLAANHLSRRFTSQNVVVKRRWWQLKPALPAS